LAASLTAEVCEFVIGLEQAPAEVVPVAKRHVLDSLGVMLSGSREAAATIARDYGPPAFQLGLRGHVDDYDDTQLATRPEGVYGLLTHPSVPVLAALLPLELSGADLLAAFVAGTEAECRLSDAIDPRHYREGFHSSGTVGTLGACLGACRGLRLDLPTSSRALGIAASSAAGLRENFGTMTKSLHVGRAAQHGLEAARLAAAGFTASSEILDAPRGFFRAFGGGFDQALVRGRLGRPWYYLDPGVSLKPHPGGSLSHPAMWEMLQLVRAHDLRPEHIEHVTVGTSSNIPNALIHHRPQDGLAAKFSMEYSMATIIVRRRGGLADYTDEAVREPAIQEMIPRIDLVADPVAEAAGYHRMLSRITVRLRDGRELCAEGDAARGHPANPMGAEEVAAKFEDCARWAGLQDGGQGVKAMVENIESLESTRDLCRTVLR
jgi:2-methylcitrate dehydratase PrpD